MLLQAAAQGYPLGNTKYGMYRWLRTAPERLHALGILSSQEK